MTSTRLAGLIAERDALEQAEHWDHAALPWLCEQIEVLEREEAAKPPAPAPTPATRETSDPVAALVADFEQAAAHPERYTEQQISDLVSRYNAMVTGAVQQAEAVDAAQVHRDMVEMGAHSERYSDEQRSELLHRYDRATRQRPVARMDSPDLAERLEAARQAQERGEEVDVDGLMGQFQTCRSSRRPPGPSTWPRMS
jgi:hypothetical protein